MDKNTIEIERKYIIQMPNVSLFCGLSGFTESDITQIYLSAERGKTRRVRRRAGALGVEYTETVKERIDGMSAHESEREITENEYIRLSSEIAEGTKPICKKRYTFLYLGQLFEIDVYPEWKRTAIMETELDSREACPRMPEFIKIVREVTGIRAYSNASMSKEFPAEDF